MEWISGKQDRRGATILLAEDDTIVRKMVTEILQLEEYEVITACDGEEAFDIFRRKAESIDLVITDIVMPRMNGKQFGRQCRARNPATRILFMSGYVSTPLNAQEDLAGASDFISKPFHPDDFLGRVRRLLDGHGEARKDNRVLAP